jgi:hypothetical protein
MEVEVDEAVGAHPLVLVPRLDVGPLVPRAPGVHVPAISQLPEPLAGGGNVGMANEDVEVDELAEGGVAVGHRREQGALEWNGIDSLALQGVEHAPQLTSEQAAAQLVHPVVVAQEVAGRGRHQLAAVPVENVGRERRHPVAIRHRDEAAPVDGSLVRQEGA